MPVSAAMVTTPLRLSSHKKGVFANYAASDTSCVRLKACERMQLCAHIRGKCRAAPSRSTFWYRGCMSMNAQRLHSSRFLSLLLLSVYA